MTRSIWYWKSVSAKSHLLVLFAKSSFHQLQIPRLPRAIRGWVLDQFQDILEMALWGVLRHGELQTRGIFFNLRHGETEIVVCLILLNQTIWTWKGNKFLLCFKWKNPRNIECEFQSSCDAPKFHGCTLNHLPSLPQAQYPTKEVKAFPAHGTWGC